MRPDMKKVVFEKYRRKGDIDGFHAIRRSKAGEEHNQLLHSMTKPYILNWSDGSQTSYHPGPVRKYLKSKVGEKWDDVWSDICKHNSTNSVNGRRVREIVGWMVEQDIAVDEDGELTWRGKYWRPWRNTFYVDPRTGLLCFYQGEKFKRPTVDETTKIVYYHGLYFYNHEGLWYEVSVWHVPEKEPASAYGWQYIVPKDIFNRVSHVGKTYWWHYRNSVYHAYGNYIIPLSKKQIGKKMIRKVEEYVRNLRGHNSK